MEVSRDYRPADIFKGRMGAGTATWSNSTSLDYGERLTRRDVQSAFKAFLDAGINLFDTAEVYGNGYAERTLGHLIRDETRQVNIATKYAARIRRLPFYYIAKRLPPHQKRRMISALVRSGLHKSLRRLKVRQVDLYQVHHPSQWIDMADLLHAMADTVDHGLARYVGVSNFDAKQTRTAHQILVERGFPLVSNQVEYSLIDRRMERNGVLDCCHELGITLIAYCPLGRGILAGKYRSEEDLPVDRRRNYWQFRPENFYKIVPLLDAMDQIGQAHGAKTPAQVALNWLVRQDRIFPIPGARNAEQACQNIGALDWEMTQNEADRLDRLSNQFN